MRILTWIVVLFLFTTACTIDKTNYESESNITNPEHNEFKEVVSVQKDNYTISLEALNGHLYKGYNEVRLKITDATTKQVVENAKVTFLPIYTTAEGKIESCPNLYDLVYDKGEKVYKGFSVFTQENTQGDWKVEIAFKDKNQSVTASQLVFVEKQNNKNLNMTSFRGIDKEDYIIALVAPIKPKVAENELVAGIYKLNAGNSSLKDAYTVVDNYTLLLDPRMPEPSMGNHSSPNNKDLVQREDKFYYGVVNYTMTGNWTLNFIMLNQHGRILKGTNVPSDFTPGVEGKKSELHIDTLF